jgi:hypothetical protein
VGPGAALDAREKKNLLPLAGIESHLHCHPAHNLVALLTVSAPLYAYILIIVLASKLLFVRGFKWCYTGIGEK